MCFPFWYLCVLCSNAKWFTWKTFFTFLFEVSESMPPECSQSQPKLERGTSALFHIGDHKPLSDRDQRGYLTPPPPTPQLPKKVLCGSGVICCVDLFLPVSTGRCSLTRKPSEQKSFKSSKQSFKPNQVFSLLLTLRTGLLQSGNIAVLGQHLPPHTFLQRNLETLLPYSSHAHFSFSAFAGRWGSSGFCRGSSGWSKG